MAGNQDSFVYTFSSTGEQGVVKAFYEIRDASGASTAQAKALAEANALVAASSQKFAAATKQAQSGLEKATEASRGLNAQTKNVSEAQRQARFAMTQLGRIGNDIRFGPLAIANNMEAVFQSIGQTTVAMQALKKQGLSTFGALKASIGGPGGIATLIGVGVTILLTFGDKIADLFDNKLKSSLKDFQKVAKDAFKFETSDLVELVLEAGKAEEALNQLRSEISKVEGDFAQPVFPGFARELQAISDDIDRNALGVLGQIIDDWTPTIAQFIGNSFNKAFELAGVKFRFDLREPLLDVDKQNLIQEFNTLLEEVEKGITTEDATKRWNALAEKVLGDAFKKGGKKAGKDVLKGILDGITEDAQLYAGEINRVLQEVINASPEAKVAQAELRREIEATIRAFKDGTLPVVRFVETLLSISDERIHSSSEAMAFLSDALDNVAISAEDAQALIKGFLGEVEKIAPQTFLQGAGARTVTEVAESGELKAREVTFNEAAVKRTIKARAEVEKISQYVKEINASFQNFAIGLSDLFVDIAFRLKSMKDLANEIAKIVSNLIKDLVAAGLRRLFIQGLSLIGTGGAGSLLPAGGGRVVPDFGGILGRPSFENVALNVTGRLVGNTNEIYVALDRHGVINGLRPIGGIRQQGG